MSISKEKGRICCVCESLGFKYWGKLRDMQDWADDWRECQRYTILSWLWSPSFSETSPIGLPPSKGLGKELSALGYVGFSATRSKYCCCLITAWSRMTHAIKGRWSKIEPRFVGTGGQTFELKNKRPIFPRQRSVVVASHMDTRKGRGLWQRWEMCNGYPPYIAAVVIKKRNSGRTKQRKD